MDEADRMLSSTIAAVRAIDAPASVSVPAWNAHINHSQVMTVIAGENMTMKERVLAIIEANPGVSSFGIHRELVRTGRAAHRFGPGTFLARLFGVKMWQMWVALENLEETGLVRAEWGPAYRVRHYWANSQT